MLPCLRMKIIYKSARINAHLRATFYFLQYFSYSSFHKKERGEGEGNTFWDHPQAAGWRAHGLFHGLSVKQPAPNTAQPLGESLGLMNSCAGVSLQMWLQKGCPSPRFPWTATYSRGCLVNSVLLKQQKCCLRKYFPKYDPSTNTQLKLFAISLTVRVQVCWKCWIPHHSTQLLHSLGSITLLDKFPIVDATAPLASSFTRDSWDQAAVSLFAPSLGENTRICCRIVSSIANALNSNVINSSRK